MEIWNVTTTPTALHAHRITYTGMLSFAYNDMHYVLKNNKSNNHVDYRDNYS